MTEDNVIDLTVRLAEAPPLDIANRNWDACKHKHKVLVEETHRVACSDCGCPDLDPFAVLVAMAKEWRSWKWQWEQLRSLQVKQEDHDRGIWERRRDRHAKAHPDHALDYTRTGWSNGECAECFTLISTGRRFQPLSARNPGE